MKTAGIVIATLLLGLHLLPALADTPAVATAPLDRAALLAAALANSPAVKSARLDYEAARDKALYSASIWQSALSLNGQYKGNLAAASSPGASSGDGLSAGTSLSIKPFEFLSLSASLDSNLSSTLNYQAGVSIKPFADTSQAKSAKQAFEDQELRYASATRTLTAALFKAWSAWAKSLGDLELADLSLDSANRALTGNQARYDTGALSAADLDSARNTALKAAKDRNDKVISELQARYDLLNQAGLPLDQAIAVPSGLDPDSLRARVAALLKANKGLVADTSVEIARRNLERAKTDAALAPGILSGLGASASVSGNANGLGSWQAGLSYSLAASNFTPQEAATRQRAIDTAAQALDTARFQQIRTQAIAVQRLNGALSQAENAEWQSAQAAKTWSTEKTRYDAGSSSEQKLSEAAQSKRMAELNAAAAWRDLETELLSWQE